MMMVTGCSSADDESADGGTPAWLSGKADQRGNRLEASIYAVGNRLQPTAAGDYYTDDVQPIVARQCVTCHGCGDAPCQLKLTSYEGVLRGSNEDDLYGPRVFGIDREYDPMHMAWGRVLDANGDIDFEKSESKWRDLDFYSILNGRSGSVLGRVLTEAHDLTENLDQSFEIAKNLEGRKFECLGDDSPKSEELVGRAMPLGLPPLSDEATTVLLNWLDFGAPGPSAKALSQVSQPTNPDAVAAWEDFLNPALTDKRARLVSRYLYEHLFFAHLQLEQSPGEFYRLIRSRTLTGPVDEIASERAFDLPKEEAYYYRLDKITSILVAKTHVVWDLSPTIRTRWDELFHKADWSLESDIAEPDSDNPFAYFAPIPASARYRFMIENSRALVDAMVRGSVCTGSGATFAIRDRFWVWFLDPDSDVSALDSVAGKRTGGPRLGRDSWYHLNPESASVFRERAYLNAYRGLLQVHRPEGLSITDLWDGNAGTNKNAWLTVLRHDKSATVQQGPQHGTPETVWVLSYSNFERLYYNLVVQFKAWSHAAHKLETWTLMSYVRSEGEDVAALLMPPSLREELRDHPSRGWGVINSTVFPTYGECSDELEDVLGKDCQYPTQVDLPEMAFDTSTERLDAVMAHLASLVVKHIGSLTLTDPLNGLGTVEIPQVVETHEDADQALDALSGWKSEGWQYLPELIFVRVSTDRDRWLYTLAANRVFESHERVYQQALDRFPAEDTLSVGRGIVGHYPGLFVDVSAEELPAFVLGMSQLNSRDDWVKFANQSMDAGTMLDRRDPNFWTFLDEVHQQWFKEDPTNAAVVDISEYLWPQHLL
ncbi:MAG: hypothetical protein ACI9OJ_003946 [Myxococcota bacterium]|jgi:hypothetical protein